MAKAINARNQGDDYQARIFWRYALGMLQNNGSVARVHFEKDEPKSFDDVVIDYDPPIASTTRPEQIHQECIQVKWNVSLDKPFGYEDLMNPKFIHASSNSILQRLKNAKLKMSSSTKFSFQTTAKIADNDPLNELISSNDKSLLLDRLFDGSTRSGKWFEVRRKMKEHLSLTTDEELREVLSDFHIYASSGSLEDLKRELELHCRVIGLDPGHPSQTDFRYDGLIWGWKNRARSSFTRDELLALLQEEGLRIDQPSTDEFLNVALRTFSLDNDSGWIAKQDNTLDLTRLFRMRYLQSGFEWQNDIQKEVSKFLDAVPSLNKKIRLHLDAHASVALLAGTVLHSKRGCEIEIIQKGRNGSKVWKGNDATDGTELICNIETVGAGHDIAIAIGVTHSVKQHSIDYIKSNLPDVGNLLVFEPEKGPSSTSISGGAHAVKIADGVVSAIRSSNLLAHNPTIHIFAACPNSILFFLGQSYNALGTCIVYEYDFDRQGNRSYQPSFQIV